MYGSILYLFVWYQKYLNYLCQIIQLKSAYKIQKNTITLLHRTMQHCLNLDGNGKFLTKVSGTFAYLHTSRLNLVIWERSNKTDMHFWYEASMLCMSTRETLNLNEFCSEFFMCISAYEKKNQLQNVHYQKKKRIF